MNKTVELDMPIFPKVRYSGWHLDEIEPSLAEVKERHYINDQAFGIEVNGQATAYQHVPDALTAQGVRVMSMLKAQVLCPELLSQYVGQVVPATTDRLVAQNFHYFNTGIFVYIPDDTQVDDVLQLALNHVATQGQDMMARIVIYVGRRVKLSIFQQMHTLGEVKSKASVVIEIIAATSAQVTYANVDAFSDVTTAYINRQALVTEHATVNWENASFNDGNVITQLESHLRAEGATSHAEVIALSSKKQVQGIMTTVENSGRHSVGHIFQRGVILNRSKLVFNGIGRIIKGAKGADAQQESRVLMLSRRARGDANPLLLIDENDVTAGHAASVGQIDENQMYYLMSRGISKKIARKLVIRGFMGEVLAKMPTKFAQQLIIDEIERKLQDENETS
ncbi:Fe-S cluster assembly protein SufD [Leuconostoc carnosum]|uniref:Fe-S cluster assembly protein SufD n=1 Tax=Leuconostoc carnosum TaxID=1252 RepID=UPI00345C70A7